MWKRLLLLLAVLMPVAAAAQTAPPDVPTPVVQTPTYASGATLNVLGDGSNARGGTMPVIANQLPDIPATSGIRSAWTTTASTGFCDVTGFPATTGASCTGLETKFRTEIGFTTHIAYDDPERNWGLPGSSHLHMFFGNATTNAFSTYASLRNQANRLGALNQIASSAAGGPLNGSGYWVPGLIETNPFGNGKNYVVRLTGVTLYYVSNPGSTATTGQFSRIPRGTRYVTGFQMDDPDACGVIGEINTANGNGSGCTLPAGTYRYRGCTTGTTDVATQTSCLVRNGFDGWKCVNGSGDVVGADGGQYYPSLKTTGGADPWGGTCLSGYKVVAVFNGPICYDGRNLWVPGAYKHFRQPIYDQQISGGVCPNGWYMVPNLSLQIAFTHQGPSDYMNMRLASDDMAATVSGHSIRNGESMHADWMGGWDDQTFYGVGGTQGFLQFCNGVDGFQPHTCNGSTFNATTRLYGGLTETTPDGTSKVSDTSATTTTAAGMAAVPPASKGPITLNAIPK